MKFHVRSMGHLEELLDRFLSFGQTTSSFVVGTPVPMRPLRVDAFADEDRRPSSSSAQR